MARQFTPTKPIKNGLFLIDDDPANGGLRIHAQKSGALVIATVRKSFRNDGDIAIGSIPATPENVDRLVEGLIVLSAVLVKASKKASKGKGKKASKKSKGSKKSKASKPSIVGDVAMLKRRRAGKTTDVAAIAPEKALEVALAGVHGNTRSTLERVLTQPHCKVVAPKQARAFRKASKPVPMAELRALVKKVQSKVS